MPDTDPKEAALQDLVKRGVPTPTDFMPDLEFFSGLYFLREVATGAVARGVVFFAELDQGGDEVDETAAEVLGSLSEALQYATHALVALGLLPQEAEDALSEATL